MVNEVDEETAALVAVVKLHIWNARLSQAEVADSTGIPLGTLKRRLAGTGATFTIRELVAIADTFGIAPSRLLAEAEALKRGDAA